MLLGSLVLCRGSDAPLGVEWQPPSVDESADAESGRCCRLLPLTAGMRMLRPIRMAVRVAGVVAALACIIRMCMPVATMAVCVPILRIVMLRPLSSLQAGCKV